ncbi:MAG: S1 RNA-binding domain-containing protein, partial [Oscillospiraceae bacterium]|nr:S1 RNA-binding domain-containing protein [Oscillospiraceae bacterium]
AVLIRSHGAAKAEFDALTEKGCEIVDATCPHVARIHRIAERAASEGRTLLILGDAAHPEVRAARGWATRSVAGVPHDFDGAVERDDPLDVVCQTTLNVDDSKFFYEFLKKDCTNVRFYDTICNATSERQKEAAQIARSHDAVVVVGDRASSNANRLAELCLSLNPRTYFVENADDLRLTAVVMMTCAGSIAITAGASTPDRLIEEVYTKMLDEYKDSTQNTEEINAVADVANHVAPETSELAPPQVVAPPEVVAEAAPPEVVAEVAPPEVVAEAEGEVAAAGVSGAEESFDQLLEQNFKTLKTGEKVSGIVMSVSPTEVTVDLGAKQSGYIPADELTNEPGAEIDQVVKIGDRVEAYVMRVNDIEGMVTLSKKRLDLTKNWDDIERAVNSKEILEGTVMEENKGGIVAMVKGFRVFIPASQSGLPKDAPMAALLHQKVRFRITEATKAKRRIVGSIRAVTSEERRENAQRIWDEIEVGKVYKGRVKTLTNFGAFIDIGGVDGMAHVSSLSWGRIKKPSSVFSIGDEVEVYVTAVDRERKKISLGYRKLDENPWLKFTETYREGDVLDVKVVSLTTFGAFAQIIPNVDGLIHVSQIAPYRVEKPADVLSEDEIVTVRITGIDYERQKISLSIRAASEPQQYVGDDAD